VQVFLQGAASSRPPTRPPRHWRGDHPSAQPRRARREATRRCAVRRRSRASPA